MNGDLLILHQILNNLLGNALKFTEEGGTISLKVNLRDSNEQRYVIQFTVEDSGIGIKKSQLATIFEEFRQADGDTKIKYGGTGLGLSISRKLVTLHGGTIRVDSVEGRGSVFTVNIPFQYTEVRDDPEPEKQQEDNGVLHVGEVLIVEDNPINRKYLSRTLQKWGINCDQAVNGLEALQMLEAKAYDLLIMDIRMPEMDGYEAIGAIRRHPNDQIRLVTAIALTADAMREEREKAYTLGFNYHITKPFRSEDLRGKLVEVMELSDHQGTEPVGDQLIMDDYFDEQALQLLYEGDKKYMMEMFAIFRRTTPHELESLSTAIASEDWTTAKAILHRCKPTFEMVGRPALTQMAGDLEFAYEKEGKLSKDALHSFVKEVEELLRRVTLEIEKPH